MAEVSFTIALDRYDRHFPFFDGTVKAPAGLRYQALQVGQGDHLRERGPLAGHLAGAGAAAGASAGASIRSILAPSRSFMISSVWDFCATY